MPVLRSKKKMYNPDDYEVLCGEEMNPFVALPAEREKEEVEKTGEQTVKPELNLNPAQPALLEAPKTRLWFRLGKLFRPA